ncbi:6-phosphogluconolactonase [Oceaniovalibus sp. ACAM 378]|uniref:6-phosphogluconolactonase n=1 Tax=Oceaniovalibus sp. ACAM 378 TaxID=2599923 RepID=UPI0011D6C299|nr:6-phosphogluconolactonase [Oceaniovalibus sp. ACAM 378]TYB90990.1 6-phosphogluconolactonase [Oceaniovalibus sp. ACAM 378]
MNLIEYSDREMLMMRLADAMASELSTNLIANDTATLAVPGGSTPGPLFDMLSDTSLHWSRVNVLLTDERRVPADHLRSNERLLRNHLLVGKAAGANFVRLVPDGPDAGEPGADLAELIARVTPVLPISILLLGMGDDMHTASLFPGSPQLEEALSTDAPLMAVDAPEGLEPRITLTASAMREAMSTHILITGAGKRAALEKAVSLAPSEAPISLVLGNATVHWAA